VLPGTRQRWESRLYHQTKQVVDLATPEGRNTGLTYVTWKRTNRELNPRPVNPKSNALPLSHHATKCYYQRPGGAITTTITSQYLIDFFSDPQPTNTQTVWKSTHKVFSLSCCQTDRQTNGSDNSTTARNGRDRDNTMSNMLLFLS